MSDDVGLDSCSTRDRGILDGWKPETLGVPAPGSWGRCVDSFCIITASGVWIITGSGPYAFYKCSKFHKVGES